MEIHVWVLLLLADFLTKFEQVSLRRHVSTVKNGAVRPFLLLQYNTVKVRERLDHQAERPEKPVTFRQKTCSETELKLLAFKQTSVLAGLFQQMGTLRARQS